MCICVCVCVCVCAHTSAWAYIYIYTHTRTHVWVHTHTRVYTCMSIYPTHSVTKWSPVLLSKTNNSIQPYLSICSQLNGSKYCYVSQKIQFNISYLFTHLNGPKVLLLRNPFNTSHLFIHILNDKHFYLILLGATTPGQSGPGSNGNKGVVLISQFSKTGAPPSDCWELYWMVCEMGVKCPYSSSFVGCCSQVLVLLVNTTAQAESLLYSLKSAARGIGLNVKQS